jgi:hypothetical protein
MVTRVQKHPDDPHDFFIVFLRVCKQDRRRDSAASTPLLASREVCTDWSVCRRTNINTHDIALGGRGKTLLH